MCKSCVSGQYNDQNERSSCKVCGSDDTTMASNGIGLEWDVKHIKTLSYELRVRIPNELNQENEIASGLLF